MKLNEEELEELQAFATSTRRVLVQRIIDDIVDNIKGNVLSVPLDKDPEKAALSLYAERMKLEGAVALKNAFIVKIQELRSKK
jgi:hypothetical protein